MLHSDYVFIPLYTGMLGFIGWSWWSESTKISTNINNVTSSPISSWPYDWTGDRVTDASAISEQLAQQRLLRLQNSVNSEERILRALEETRQSTSAILRKLEEIRQIRSASDSSLMIPQTPNSVETAVEAVNHISQNAEFMINTVGFF